MAIVAIYHDNTSKKFKTFNEITDYNNVQVLDCFDCLLTTLPNELPDKLIVLKCAFNNITELPELPTTLEYLTCNNNKLTKIPELPNSVQHFGCSYNNLTKLPKLPNTLKYLSCHNNQLTSLSPLPTSLQSIYCNKNQLTTLPPSIILCRNLSNFDCSNNPLELTVQQQNFINWLENRNTVRNNGNYYQDTQNVHNSSLQRSLNESIHNLLSN